MAYLRKQGRFVDSEEGGDTVGDAFVENEAGLAQCYAGSMQGVLTLGPNTGKRVVRLFGQAAEDKRDNNGKPAHGFDVHAGTHVSAHDKKALERLCRYLLRPPLSHDRLKLLGNGNVQLRLKTAWNDGTTHLEFEPLDFMSKLAALVPPPRTHLVRYAGVFAPNHKLRKWVIPKPPEKAVAECDGHTAKTPPKPQHRLSWALLMKRVFEVDVTLCPKCQTKGMQVIAQITKTDAIHAILRSAGLSTEAPKIASARLPSQGEFGF